MDMKLFKKGKKVVVLYKGIAYTKDIIDWNKLINRKGLYNFLKSELDLWQVLEGDESISESENWDPPIDRQEIWAAGVTYWRSREARMEESQSDEGASFYDLVYNASRPELFFKATSQRTVGNMGVVNMRSDSNWDVPEPELTLFVSSEGTIEGYTIGNDMSSRSIEGENPLYLPQAKVYEACASIGPCLYVPESSISPKTRIEITIVRCDEVLYKDQVSIDQMKRGHEELVGYLFRACKFPFGAFLMTGTAMVPDDNFTLHKGDKISIEIEGIGTLVNYVGEI